MKCQKTLAALAIIGVSSLAAVAAPPKTEQPASKVQKGQVQTNKNQAGENTSKAAGERTMWKNADHMLASCVAIDNQEEVAIAKFAMKKLSNDDAKDFAKMVIDDHTAFLMKLKEYAPEATREGFMAEGRMPARERSDAGNKDPLTSKATQRTAAKPNLDEQGAMMMPIDLMMLHRELAQQCLANTEEMLNEKDGKHFDECFIGMQIAKHAAMKTKLEVFQRHASGEFKELLAMGLKTTTAHMEQAKKIMEEMDGSPEKTADSK